MITSFYNSKVADTYVAKGKSISILPFEAEQSAR